MLVVTATTMYPVFGVFCFDFILRNVGFPAKFVEVAGLGSDLVKLVRVGEFSTALAFPRQVLAGLRVVVLGLAVGTQVLGFLRGNTLAHNLQLSFLLISGIKSRYRSRTEDFLDFVSKGFRHTLVAM